jgi:hypothetical protein
VTRQIGEFVVDRVDGKHVVRQADPLILVDRDFLDAYQGTAEDGASFEVDDIRYNVLGPSPEHGGALLCERVA